VAAPTVGTNAVLLTSPAVGVPCPGGEAVVAMIAVGTPVVMVVVVLVQPNVVATLVATPSREALSLRVQHPVVLVKGQAGLAVHRPPNPSKVLQEGEILYYLEMVV
jgi:hypothetical protein